MKTIKRIVLATGLFLSATGVYAGCLSQFNQSSMACEGQYTFERYGCKLDAVVEYWDCVGNSATS